MEEQEDVSGGQDEKQEVLQVSVKPKEQVNLTVPVGQEKKKQEDLQVSGRPEKEQESMTMSGGEKEKLQVPLPKSKEQEEQESMDVYEKPEDDQETMTLSGVEGEKKQEDLPVSENLEKEQESMDVSVVEEEERKQEEQEDTDLMEKVGMVEVQPHMKPARDLEETVTLDELSVEDHVQRAVLDQSWEPPLACSTPKRGASKKQERMEHVEEVEEAVIVEEPDLDFEETFTVDEESDHLFVGCLRCPLFWDMELVCQVQSKR